MLLLKPHMQDPSNSDPGQTVRIYPLGLKLHGSGMLFKRHKQALYGHGGLLQLVVLPLGVYEQHFPTWGKAVRHEWPEVAQDSKILEKAEVFWKNEDAS